MSLLLIYQVLWHCLSASDFKEESVNKKWEGLSGGYTVFIL